MITEIKYFKIWRMPGVTIGFIARRDERHGCWFIEEFVLVLELFAHEDDLEELNRKVSVEYEKK